MTLNEVLERLIKLTNDNIEILSTINKSFTTKAEHLALTVDQQQYTIPSFLALENKVGTLQRNIENLVNAPNTGECFMYFDGNSQKVQLSGYSTFPNGLTLDSNITTFSVYQNDIFKDFLTPRPYIRFNVAALSNAVKDVSVKKVVLKNPNLIAQVQQMTTSSNGTVGNGAIMSSVNYGDLYKKLYVYSEDTDYVDYDRIVRLPLRKQNCTGTYRITEIIANYTDSNFEEFYELVLDRDLKYLINDDTIERDIHIGDQLVTYNDKVKMEIVDIQPLTRKITVKMLESGYADLVTGNSDMALLKFFRSIDFDRDKQVDVPLEEDRFVCVFIAGINDTTNTRAPWSTGVFIDTTLLTLDSDGVTPFGTYYYENVNNIGDTLYDITHFLNSSVYNLSVAQLNSISQYKPVIDSSKLIVTQINKHLNDSDSVKTIRSLYAQKTRYKTELDSTQRSINNINDILATTTFSTNNNTRTLYETQLSELNTRKVELTENIIAISNDINEAVNSSDTPIENAKYHVRGFVDCTIPSSITVQGIPFDVIAIECEYRYKNRNKMSGNAETIGQDLIYTDWVRMPSVLREKHYDGSRGIIEWVLDSDNDGTNETSFNQIDIPITQGEMVDIRYRWVYSLGYPFVAVRSDWSEIYTQDFPEEFNKDVPVLTIIEENNNEIQKNVYKAMLAELGVLDHVNDKVIDQTLTYFHDPAHIASGFYTEERRVIPLGSKLSDMDTLLNDLYSEVYGSFSSNLSVTISDNINTTVLVPDIDNFFTVQDYASNENTKTIEDLFGITTANISGVSVALSSLTITLTNVGLQAMKIHTLFPGSPEAILKQTTTSTVFGGNNLWGQTTPNDDGPAVYIQTSDSYSATAITPQKLNQLFYFRLGTIDTAQTPQQTEYYFTDIQTPYTLTNYTDGTLWDGNNATRTIWKTLASKLAVTPFIGAIDSNTYISNTSSYQYGPYINYSSLYPYIVNNNTFFLPAGTSYVTLQPGNSVSIPMNFYYILSIPENTTDRSLDVTNLTTRQTICFDVRTSLFKDPTTYKVTVEANRTNSVSYRTLRGQNNGFYVGTAASRFPNAGSLTARLRE